MDSGYVKPFQRHGAEKSELQPAKEQRLATGVTEEAHRGRRAGHWVSRVGGGGEASCVPTSLKSCLDEFALSSRPLSRPG